MKITGKSYFLIGIMLFLLFVLGWSLFAMEYFESKLLPLLIGSIVLVLSAVQLGIEIAARREPKLIEGGDEGDGADVPEEDARQYLIHGAWVGAFVLGIYVLGFTAAVSVFVLLYMKRLGTKWRDAIIFAIIVPAFLYGLFELALDIELYRGLVFGWLDA